MAPAPGQREQWLAGHELVLNSVPLEALGRGVKLVVTEGTYGAKQLALSRRWT